MTDQTNIDAAADAHASGAAPQLQRDKASATPIAMPQATNRSRPRRMARAAEPGSADDQMVASSGKNADPNPTAATGQPAAIARSPSKLDRLEELLLQASGASIAEMMAATGWQAHSVRGAMAGALKKRGLTIISERANDLRRYRATREA